MRQHFPLDPTTGAESQALLPWSDGVPQTGAPGSYPGHALVTDSEAEILAAIDGAGLTRSGTDLAQLLRAIRGQVASYLVDAGVANAIVVAATPVHTQYTAGQILRVKLAATMTGPTTLELDGLAPCAVSRADGSPTQAGDGVKGQILDLLYDGAEFQIQGLISGRTPKTRTALFANPGVNTWVVPIGVTEIDAFLYAGSGGGGGGISGSAGGGGGAGGYCEGTFPVVPGETLTIVVGTFGTPGTAAPTNGGNGGSSSLSSALSGSLLSATPGGGGGGGYTTTAFGSAGAGGAASGGRFQYPGGTAGGGYTFNGSRAVGGFGAPSYRGTIIPGTDANGTQGYGPGAGGAGGANGNVGGAGRPGQVTINF